jgi:hypothetical protein
VRTFSATFLLFVLLLPLSGEYIWLSLKKMTVKSQVKHRMMASIDKSEFMMLRFTTETAADELEWEHSKEFEYKGEMYDVIQSSITTDSAIYWVWWDAEESQLNKELKALVDQTLTNSTNKSEQNLVAKFQFSQNYTVPDHCDSFIYALNLPIIWSVGNQPFYQLLLTSTISPPPQV